MLEPVDLTQQLIRIPSLSGEEGKIAEFLANKLEKFCDNIQVDKEYNIIAEIAGNGKGPTILFNAHLDHAPTGEMKEPYSARLMDGKIFGTVGQILYGRGACDTKGALAAMTCAAEQLAATRKFNGKLIITFVTREELGGGHGTKETLEKLKEKPEVVILGEPTDLKINLGHRGKVEFILETIGKSAHASNPDNGVNAILLMNDFINAWRKVLLPYHEVLGQCTSAITNIKVPDPGRTAIIPNLCTLAFDRRYLPEETVDEVYDQIREILEELEELKENNPDFRYNLKILYTMPPYFISPENRYIVTLQQVLKRKIGKAALGSWIAGTDGAFIVNDYGIPTIGLGPGKEEHLHTASDHVSVNDLEAATDVYRDFVLLAGNRQ